MTPHPEKRLITIDAETVERVRAWAKSAQEDAARSILAAWEEGAERRDVQREHYPTDKCPDPDCAYAQEAASLHVQVSRLESRLDSTRGELERTRERLREAEQEIAHKLTDPARSLCGRTVAPFRAQCMLPEGHPGECSPARPSEVPEEAE